MKQRRTLGPQQCLCKSPDPYDLRTSKYLLYGTDRIQSPSNAFRFVFWSFEPLSNLKVYGSMKCVWTCDY